MFGNLLILLLVQIVSTIGADENDIMIKLDHLSRRTDELSADVEHISARNVQLEEELRMVKTRLRAEEENTRNLQRSVDDLNEGDKKLRTSLAEVYSTVSVLNGTCGSHAKHGRQLTDPTVAFSAVISPANLANLNPGQGIVFDQVITSVGQAYDPLTGIFTAPTSGVYVFNMDVLVEPGENEYLEFVRDGRHVMYNYAHASGSLHDASSSRTVVLELKNRSQVWVRSSLSAQHGSGTVHGNGFTTFSGFLVAFTG